MAREKLINQNFTGRTFVNRAFLGYYRGCTLTDAVFIGCTFNCVAINCDFTRADFRDSTIERVISPGSTFTDAKFPRGVRTLHNHQIIAELLRQYVMNTVPAGMFQDRCLTYVQAIRDSTLSWDRLTVQAPDDVIRHGFYALRNYPRLYALMRKWRVELEPPELSHA